MVAIVTESNEIIHDANIQIEIDFAPTIRFLHRIQNTNPYQRGR